MSFSGPPPAAPTRSPAPPLLQPEIDLSRDDFAERYTTKEALAIDWEELTLLAEHTVGFGWPFAEN